MIWTYAVQPHDTMVIIAKKGEKVKDQNPAFLLCRPNKSGAQKALLQKEGPEKCVLLRRVGRSNGLGGERIDFAHGVLQDDGYK